MNSAMLQTGLLIAVVDPDKVKPIAADDADDVGWFTIIRVQDSILLKNEKEVLTMEDLAFDHREIIADALKKV